jgi:LuxR family maltose regulon positive regulatory protein
LQRGAGEAPRRSSSTGRIRRPVLAADLAAAVEGGAVLLVAPAGGGKTLALEEALAVDGRPVAWVRCSEADRDPGWLLAHLVHAVTGAMPGAADVLADRLAAAPERVDTRLAVRELQAELERLLVDPLTIVFDDAEWLAPSPEVARVVSDLLAARASLLRVAVCSRQPLPLGMAKLRATGRLTELGPADLAFSVEECAQLLRERGGHDPPSEEVEAVWQATEGWPLGVALAGRSRHTPQAAAAATRALDRYLAEEVLDPLDPSLPRRCSIRASRMSWTEPWCGRSACPRGSWARCSVSGSRFGRSITPAAGSRTTRWCASC